VNAFLGQLMLSHAASSSIFLNPNDANLMACSSFWDVSL
jgi:hypothetical protein